MIGCGDAFGGDPSFVHIVAPQVVFLLLKVNAKKAFDTWKQNY